MKSLNNYYDNSPEGRKQVEKIEKNARRYMGETVRVKSRNHHPHPWVNHGEMKFEEAIKRGRNYEFHDTIIMCHKGEVILHWQVLSPPTFYP